MPTSPRVINNYGEIGLMGINIYNRLIDASISPYDICIIPKIIEYGLNCNDNHLLIYIADRYIFMSNFTRGGSNDKYFK